MQSENPYEPPAVEEVAAPPLPVATMELASLSERFLGAFINGLIITAFSFLCGYALYLAGFIRSFDDYDNLGILGTTLLTFVSFAFNLLATDPMPSVLLLLSVGFNARVGDQRLVPTKSNANTDPSASAT